MKIEEIEFYLDITLDRFIVTNPYLGAVTLKRDGREFILDVCKSYQYDDDDCCSGTTIQCDLEVDKDTFEDCPFDLTVEDLLSEDIYAEFYISSENEEDGEFEVERMTLNFTIDGENKKIKVVED